MKNAKKKIILIWVGLIVLSVVIFTYTYKMIPYLEEEVIEKIFEQVILRNRTPPQKVSLLDNYIGEDTR